MDKIFINNVSDLTELQRTSYYNFLYNGIEQEFINVPNPINITVNFIKTTHKIIVKVPVYIYFNDLVIQGGDSLYESLYLDESYTIKIYIKIKTVLSFKLNNFLFKNKKQNRWLTDKLFIGEIPLMTDEGTFLITGCERIVISQILRSPGVYFKKEFDKKLETLRYSAKVISDYEYVSSVKFTLLTNKELKRYNTDVYHPQGSISSPNISNYSKISLTPALDIIFLEYSSLKTNNESIEALNDYPIYLDEFFRWFGISYIEVYDYLKHSKFLKNQQFDIATNKDGLPKLNSTKNILSNYYNRDLGAFSIGKKARHSLNQKFNLQIPLSFTYLNIFDFLNIIDGLIELKYLNRPQDDADHIKNKYIRSIGDFLQLQLNTTISFNSSENNSLEDNYLEDIVEESNIDSYFYENKYNNISKNIEYNPNYENKFYAENINNKSNNSINRDLYPQFSVEKILDFPIKIGYTEYFDDSTFTNLVESFFKTNPLSQFMDQINPLSEMTQKRKISVFGPNGLQRGSFVSTKVRDIHPSQYGRFCPVSTPEGEDAGLILSLALFARVGKHGFLETPYFSFIDGNYQNNKQIIYLDPAKESQVEVGFSDIILSSNKDILSKYVSVKKNYSFLIKKIKDLDYLFISPLQIFSLAASLIPFIEHNDANRALMGSNMQRQAVPLLIPQKSIVGTGLEATAAADSTVVIKAISEGVVLLSTSEFIEIKDIVGQQLIYFLAKYYKSNQDTAFNQRSIVWPGEKIYSGQIIADGFGTLDGELALGRNLLIAYMPWEGYNFEDAIVINENLVINNSLTSIHIKDIETELRHNNKLKSKLLKKKKKEKYRTTIITENKLERLKKKLHKKKTEKYVQKNTENINTPNFKKSNLALINMDDFFNRVEKSKYLNNPLKYNNKIKNYVCRNKDFFYIQNSFQKEYPNRNLNKYGIINIGAYVKKNDILVAKIIYPTILSMTEQLYSQMRSMILNESSVPSRDTSLRVSEGYEGRILNIKCYTQKLLPSLESFMIPKMYIRISVAQLRKVEMGDKLAGRHGNKGVISKILSREDMPYLPDGTPIDILFNPLGVPSRMNTGQLFESMLGFAGEKLGKYFKILPFDEIYGKEASRILVNLKMKEAARKSKLPWFFSKTLNGKIYLKDGRTGEYFDNPIMVGRSYILKLIHLVEDKIHARSVGPYSSITAQPLAGKANDGGQRFGEMEVWALEAFGCSNTLQELLTIKSDDIDSQVDLNQSLMTEITPNLPMSSVSEGFILLIKELNGLGFDLSLNCINSNVSSVFYFKNKNFNIFNLLEKRLELRNYLSAELTNLNDLTKDLNLSKNKKINIKFNK